MYGANQEREMKNIGTIKLTDSSEILFYVDTYQGNQYANIRKFIRSKKYTGPTKSGVMLKKDDLQSLIDCFQNYSDIEDLEECMLCEYLYPLPSI